MTLRTVEDALRVLDLLAARGQITTREIATELSRSRSGAYRVVRTLQDRGWTTDVGNGTYQLGPMAIAIGARAWSTLPLSEFAGPWLRTLVERTAETSTLSLLVGLQRVCVEQVESPRQIRMSVPRGHPYPLYAGASGRSILCAFDSQRLEEYLHKTALEPFTPGTVTDIASLRTALENDRRVGYSVARAERDPEAFSVASAIVGKAGVVGSIAICGPVSRFTDSSARQYGELTREASAAISEHMGGRAVHLAG